MILGSWSDDNNIDYDEKVMTKAWMALLLIMLMMLRMLRMLMTTMAMVKAAPTVRAAADARPHVARLNFDDVEEEEDDGDDDGVVVVVKMIM